LALPGTSVPCQLGIWHRQALPLAGCLASPTGLATAEAPGGRSPSASVSEPEPELAAAAAQAPVHPAPAPAAAAARALAGPAAEGAGGATVQVAVRACAHGLGGRQVLPGPPAGRSLAHTLARAPRASAAARRGASAVQPAGDEQRRRNRQRRQPLSRGTREEPRRVHCTQHGAGKFTP